MADYNSGQQAEVEDSPHRFPMPNSLLLALGAVVVCLGYMAAVLAFGLLGVMLATPTFGLLLIGFLAALIGLAKKHNRDQGHTRDYVALLVAIVGLILFLIPGLGTIRLLNLHCRIRVAQTGGADELQRWAVDLLAQPRADIAPWSGTEEDVEQWVVPPAHWSEQVTRLKPQRIFITRLFQNDGEAVQLAYGGGFLHWNIVVGPPGVTGDLRRNAGRPNSLWFRWADGLYCWFPD